jgi:hypothetical protein
VSNYSDNRIEDYAAREKLNTPLVAGASPMGLDVTPTVTL